MNPWPPATGGSIRASDTAVKSKRYVAHRFSGNFLRKDEAIDAATFLALRELREPFEQSRQSPQAGR
jgi:hypothetical protein